MHAEPSLPFGVKRHQAHPGVRASERSPPWHALQPSNTQPFNGTIIIVTNAISMENLPMETTDRAKEYSRTKDRLALLGMAASLLSVAGYIASGTAARLNQRLLPGRGASLVQRTRYTATLSLISWLTSLPLSFYGGHIVEKRFGLSNQPATGWAIDNLKGKVISTPIELGIIEGMYAAIRRWPRTWWLVCAGAVIPLTTLFAQLFPVLILPRFNKYEPLHDEALAQRLRDLTDRQACLLPMSCRWI